MLLNWLQQTIYWSMSTLEVLSLNKSWMDLVQEPQLMWLEITVWKLLNPFCGSMCLCGDASGELRDSVSPSTCTVFHQDSVRWKMPGLWLTDSSVVQLQVVSGLRWDANNQIWIQEPKTNAAIFSFMKSWKYRIRKGYGNHPHLSLPCSKNT